MEKVKDMAGVYCSNCKHKKVCKYTEKLNEAVKEVKCSSIPIVSEDNSVIVNFEVWAECNYFEPMEDKE